jgi:hypothetical protein
LTLAELFASGAPAGAWAPAVDPAVAGELVIAAVKGASLDPEHAVGALRQLERLYTRPAISRSRLLRTTARAFFRLCGAVGPLRRAVFSD